MFYKSKIERNLSIVQFVGDCITKKVMPKSSAVAVAARAFNLSEPQIYYILRRHVRDCKNREENLEERQNG